MTFASLTIDLTKGYWQVPVKESDREKTAFSCHRGLYEFNTMPFGLKGLLLRSKEL